MHRITGYWHERSALQSLAVRRLSGNDDNGPLFWHERRRCSRRSLGDPLATMLVDPYFHLYFPPSFSDTHTDIDNDNDTDTNTDTDTDTDTDTNTNTDSDTNTTDMQKVRNLGT